MWLWLLPGPVPKTDNLCTSNLSYLALAALNVNELICNTYQFSNSQNCEGLTLPSQCPDVSVCAIDSLYIFNVKPASTLDCLLFSRTPVIRSIWPLNVSCKIYNNWANWTNLKLSCAYASLPFPKTVHQLLQCYSYNTSVGPCVFSSGVFNMR